MNSRSWLRLLVIAALLTLLIPLAVTASADGDDDQFTPPEKTELKYPNLGSMLNQLVARVEDGEASAEDAAEEAPVHREASVAVTIYLSGNVDDVVAFLEDNGGSLGNVGQDFIEAYVPVPLLGQTSEQPGVLRVRAIIPPEDDYGDFTSQGVQAHLAEAWHEAGYSGQGVKVGVIDGNFDFRGFSDLMGTELPTTVETRCYTDVDQPPTANLADCEGDDPDEDTHGTAVAEAVIDIAPEASLYIASPLSRAQANDAVDWMVSQGVSVIVRSEGSGFDGPGDGTSPDPLSPLKTVDRAVDGGIIWVNSAGNQARRTWFLRGPYSDPDGDKYINFSPSDEGITMSLEDGDRVRVRLRWDDSWGGASRDFDLFLRPTGSVEDVEKSVIRQAGGDSDVPYEWMVYTVPSGSGGNYAIFVVHESGSVPDWIQLSVSGDVGSIQHYTENGSITNPGESANPGMLAVGAAHYYDTNTIANYSSRGPTPDGRKKPDIVGAACGESATYPAYLRDGQRCWFSGTSQAAPHVAGLAALVKQRFPNYTPEQVADYLKDNAEARGTVPNNT